MRESEKLGISKRKRLAEYRGKEGLIPMAMIEGANPHGREALKTTWAQSRVHEPLSPMRGETSVDPF